MPQIAFNRAYRQWQTRSAALSQRRADRQGLYWIPDSGPGTVCLDIRNLVWRYSRRSVRRHQQLSLRLGFWYR